MNAPAKGQSPKSWPHFADRSYRGDDKIARVLDDRARLPKVLRPLHRILTGVPDPSAPVPKGSPLGAFARDIGLLAGFSGAAAIGGDLLASGSFIALIGGPLAVAGSLGTVGRLRRLVVGHNHEAGHGSAKRFYMNEAGWTKKSARYVNEAIINLSTSLTFTTNGQDYRREHYRHHAIPMLGTLRDPDGAQLEAWGFWGGMGRGEFRRHLLRTIFSPAWHARFLLARFRSNLLKGRPCRRALGLASLLALGASATVLPLPAWIAAVLIPWTWGYHTASLLQVLTRHNYPHREGARALADYVDRTWERIPWSPMPDAFRLDRGSFKAWAGWTATLLLAHVPARLTVLDSSMIWHGWHHAAWPAGVPFDDWWNIGYRAIAARRDGAIPEVAASRVLWGLPEALRRQASRMESPLQ